MRSLSFPGHHTDARGVVAGDRFDVLSKGDEGVLGRGVFHRVAVQGDVTAGFDMENSPCLAGQRQRRGSEAVGGGAQLLGNLTNDGWFGFSGELEQHLVNAVFRCVETRVPMVRCTNTGTTASIDPFGRVDRWLPAHTEGVANRTIPIYATSTPTFYTRHGDLFSPACARGRYFHTGIWFHRVLRPSFSNSGLER